MEHTSQVKLVSYNSKHTEVCASAARISTTQGDAVEIFEKAEGNEKNTALIGKVLQSGHKSVIEHVTFTFAFKNVSAFVEQFFIESRLASFTVKSRRYVDFSRSGYYVPPQLPEDADKKYRAYMDLLFEAYQKLLELDIPREDARFVLPYSFHSNFYCTLNARELAHILRDIRQGRGQGFPELLRIADMMADQVTELFPAIQAELQTTAQSDAGSRPSGGAFAPSPEASISGGSSGSPIAGSGNEGSSSPFLVSETASFISAKEIGAVTLCSAPVHPAKILEMAWSVCHPGSEPDCRSLTTSERPRELEQLSYCFQIRNLTLSGITHLVRHRMQSILIPSIARLDHSRYILPDTIKNHPEAERVYRGSLETANAMLPGIAAIPALRPCSCYFAVSGNLMDVLTTMNARELLHFLKLRTCSRAQWEIRDISIDLLGQLRDSFPELFNLYGPSCFVTGRCPEGRMTCGKINEIKKQFS